MQNYVEIGILGQGSFGRVFQAKRKTDEQTFAVKMIPVVQQDMESIRSEARMLFEMNHPNVVRYYDSFTHKRRREGLCFCIVLEFCSKGSLFQLVRRTAEFGRQFPEFAVRLLVHQIAEALAYLHAKGVVHRDLKTDNILFGADGVLKLTDFGLVRLMETGATSIATKTGGHICYQAPEMLTEGKVSPSVDMWAAGCILCELATMEFTFRRVASTNSPFALNRSAQAKAIEDVRDKHECLAALAEQLLESDPALRPTAAAVLQQLPIGVIAAAVAEEQYQAIFRVLTEPTPSKRRGRERRDPRHEEGGEAHSPDSRNSDRSQNASTDSERDKGHGRAGRGSGRPRMLPPVAPPVSGGGGVPASAARSSLICLNLLVLVAAVACGAFGALLVASKQLIFGVGATLGTLVLGTCGFLLLLALTGFAAAQWRSLRLMHAYTALLILLLVAMVVMLVCALAATNGAARGLLLVAWSEHVNQMDPWVCDFQAAHNCSGFDLRDLGCDDFCPPPFQCDGTCYEELQLTIRGNFLGVALAAVGVALVAGVCLVASCVLSRNWKGGPIGYELVQPSER
eukprot:TRINITY_DN14086_c0_g2_i1.p1 TRINITY_DN14086_c0_g2~~TRINITY_DN14086_c0_g2_i1.p1  ORF type:complete len:570 (+),score=106.18 TRINITY_DN14086_c0_g2_i1:47-1756(+)